MSRPRVVLQVLVLATLVAGISCFSPSTFHSRYVSLAPPSRRPRALSKPSAPSPSTGRSWWLGMATEEKTAVTDDMELQETTEKYGLEAGLFKALKSGGDDKGVQAKDLLQRYGSAYLITSISLAAVSFGVCYVAVSNGVDIQGLLGKFGITSGATAENAGTVAVAYAIHKAASPIRFPPTVALTPVVAKFLGKKEEEEVEQG
ncbi:unnamed protein product [Discosporangium mesarthrocarpum]